jgi:hypothetical protein
VIQTSFLTLMVVMHWQFKKIVLSVDACNDESARNKLLFSAIFFHT